MKDMPIESGFKAINNYRQPISSYHTSAYNGGAVLMVTVSSIRNINQEYDYQVLKTALKNTIRMYRFMEEYSDLLQEYISSDDYEEAMTHFHERTNQCSHNPHPLSDEEIAYNSKLILSIIQEELGSDEIADILNVDVFDVERALNKNKAVVNS